MKYILDDETVEISADDFISLLEKKYQCEFYRGAAFSSKYSELVVDNPIRTILIEYDDVVECRYFEAMVKERNICFAGKREVPSISAKSRSSCTLSHECKAMLNELKKGTISYEDVIWILLANYLGK